MVEITFFPHRDTWYLSRVPCIGEFVVLKDYENGFGCGYRQYRVTKVIHDPSKDSHSTDHCAEVHVEV